jgi:hypothetical protein
MWIRMLLLLLIKVMKFSDLWTTDPPGLHLSLNASTVSVHGTLLLHFEPIKLLNFYFSADSDAAFHSNPGV